MKKIIFILLICILCLTHENVQAAENTTLYFFMSTTCSHCTAALESLNDLKGEYDDQFDIVIFDIDLNDNYELYKYVVELYDLGYYVPLFLVGEDYASVGYGEDVLKAAVDAASDSSYTDILEDMISENLSSYTAYSLKVACEKKGITYYDEADEQTDDVEDEVFEEEIEKDSEEEMDVESEENVEVYVMEEANDESSSLNENFNYYTVFIGLGLVGIFAIVIFKFN